MPNPQAEYERSLLTPFVHDGQPTGLLKSLVLNATVNEDYTWTVRGHLTRKCTITSAGGSYSYTATAVGRHQIMIYPPAPANLSDPKMQLTFDDISSSLQSLSQANLRTRIQAFWQAQERPLPLEWLDLICSTVDLTQVLQQVQRDGKATTEHPSLEDYCPYRYELVKRLHDLHSWQQKATEEVVLAWTKAACDYCLNPRVNRPPFTLRLYRYDGTLAKLLRNGSLLWANILRILPYLHSSTILLLMQHDHTNWQPSQRENDWDEELLATLYWYYNRASSKCREVLDYLEKNGAWKDFIPHCLPDYATDAEKTLYHLYQAADFDACENFLRQSDDAVVATLLVKVDAHCVIQKICYDLIAFWSQAQGSSATEISDDAREIFCKKHLIVEKLLDKLISIKKTQRDVLYNDTFGRPLSRLQLAAKITQDSQIIEILQILGEGHGERDLFFLWHLPIDLANPQQTKKLQQLLQNLSSHATHPIIEAAEPLDRKKPVWEILDAVQSLDSDHSADPQGTARVIPSASEGSPVAMRDLDAQAPRDVTPGFAASSVMGIESSKSNTLLFFILTHNPWIAKEIEFSLFAPLLTTKAELTLCLQILGYALLMDGSLNSSWKQCLLRTLMRNPSIFLELQLHALAVPSAAGPRSILATINAIFCAALVRLRMDPSGWLPEKEILKNINYFMTTPASEVCFDFEDSICHLLGLDLSLSSAHSDVCITAVLLLLQLAEKLDDQQPDLASPARILPKIFAQHRGILSHVCTLSRIEWLEVVRILKKCPASCVLPQIEHCMSIQLALHAGVNKKDLYAEGMQLLHLANHLHVTPADEEHWHKIIDILLDLLFPKPADNDVHHMFVNYLYGAGTYDDILAFFRTLSKMGRLEKFLEPKERFWWMITNNIGLHCRTTNEYKPMCRILFEHDPTWFTQFLPKQLIMLVDDAFEIVDGPLCEQSEGSLARMTASLSSLLECCSWVATPFSDSEADNHIFIILAKLIISKAILVSQKENPRVLLPDHYPIVVFFDKFLLNLIIKPRAKNVDHFHSGLQLRDFIIHLLSFCIIRGSHIASAIIFHFLDHHGLLPELFLGSAAVKATAEPHPPTIFDKLLNQLLNSTRDSRVEYWELLKLWELFALLCETLTCKIETPTQSRDLTQACLKPDEKIQLISAGRAWQQTQEGWAQTGELGLPLEQILKICLTPNAQGLTLFHQFLGLFAEHYTRVAVSQPLSARFSRAIEHITTLQIKMFLQLPDEKKADFVAGSHNPAKNMLAIVWDSYTHLNLAQLEAENSLADFNTNFEIVLHSLFNPARSSNVPIKDIQLFRMVLLIFLTDPKRRAEIEQYLCSDTPHTVFQLLPPAIAFHICDKHANPAIQCALPRYTLLLLKKDLEAYVAAFGIRHHKEKIKLLLPLIDMALQDSNMPALFLDVLFFVLYKDTTAAIPTDVGHFVTLLRRFNRLGNASLDIIVLIKTLVIEKKYYFCAILWLGILENAALKKVFITHFFAAIDEEYAQAKAVGTTQTFVQWEPDCIAQIDRDLATILNEPQGVADDEQALIHTLAMATKLKPTHQKKLPCFSLAILRRELQKYVQMHSDTKSVSDNSAVAHKIIQACQQSPQEFVASLTNILLHYKIDTTLWTLLNLFLSGQQALGNSRLQTERVQRLRPPVAAIAQPLPPPTQTLTDEAAVVGPPPTQDPPTQQPPALRLAAESEPSSALESMSTMAAKTDTLVCAQPFTERKYENHFFSRQISEINWHVVITYLQEKKWKDFIAEKITERTLWPAIKLMQEYGEIQYPITNIEAYARWRIDIFFQTLHKRYLDFGADGSLLEALLVHGRLLHTLINNQLFSFDSDPHRLVILCRALYAVDRDLFARFLQAEIGNLVGLCCEQDLCVRGATSHSAQNLLRELFAVCNWVATPYTNTPDKSNLLHTLKSWILERATSKQMPRFDFHMNYIIQCLLQALVVNVRQHGNQKHQVDNFHQGLQIRRLLCDLILSIDFDAEPEHFHHLYDAVLQEGLMPELWIGIGAEGEKNPLLLHHTLQQHRIHATCLLLEKLNAKEPIGSWSQDTTTGEWQRGSKHPSVFRFEMLLAVDADNNTILNAGMQEFIHQLQVDLSMAHCVFGSPLLAPTCINPYLMEAVRFIEILCNSLDRAFRTHSDDEKVDFLSRRNTVPTAANPFELLWDQYQSIPRHEAAESFHRNRDEKLTQLAHTILEKVFTALLNSALCAAPTSHLHPKFVLSFLHDPKRAASIDQDLYPLDQLRVRVGIPRILLAHLVPLICDRVEDKQPLGDILGPQRTEIQNKLPRLTLILLIEELKQYLKKMGSKHHKHKIIQLLPLAEQAIADPLLSPLFIGLLCFILQGGVNNNARPNPEGTLAGIMQRFRRELKRLPRFSESILTTIVPEKTKYLYDVLLLAIQGDAQWEKHVQNLFSKTLPALPNAPAQEAALAQATSAAACSAAQAIQAFEEGGSTKWGEAILSVEVSLTDARYSLFFTNRLTRPVSVGDDQAERSMFDPFIGDNSL